jgi:hypothetical protein
MESLSKRPTRTGGWNSGCTIIGRRGKQQHGVLWTTAFPAAWFHNKWREFAGFLLSMIEGSELVDKE